MYRKLSHRSITTRLLLINLSAILVLGGIIFVSFYLFKDIEGVVKGIVRRDVPQVIVNSRAGEELANLFAELLVDIFYGREGDVKTKSARFEQLLDQLFQQNNTNAYLQEPLKEFMEKLSYLHNQSHLTKDISEKLKKMEAEIVYSIEVLQDIIGEKIEILTLEGKDSLDFRYMEQLKAMHTRYRSVFLDITMQVAELRSGNIQFISEQKQPVIMNLDYFHLELQTLLAADAEIREQGKILVQMILNYKEAVTRLLQATEAFQRQLNEVSVSKDNIMNAFKEVNEAVAKTARKSQENIEARLKSSGKIIVFLSIAVFVVISFITYSVFKMFKELQKRAIELAEATENAQAANAAKSDFLARMSHEIRTPLNAVTGLTNIVLKSELSSEQRDYLNKVKIASNNLLEVINDILDFSKVEAGRLELENHPFNLDQVLEQLADLFWNRVAQKDVELIFSVAPDVPRQLTGDSGRLTQVLTNLVENAVKFTETGEIAVRVEPAEPADLKIGQASLKFIVSDTGVGIDADVLPTLFDPFTQADSSLTRRHEGTGLGLAICRRLVGLMGGTIDVKSSPGQGCTFSFTIKLEIGKEYKPEFRRPVDIRGLKALVVDDSESARPVLVELLESFTFNVTAVNSGEKAIDALHRATVGEPYKLVLIDWKMPGIDGMETARRIRRDKNIQRPPFIIMVTAYGHELVQKRMDKTVVDTLLFKPVKPSQLFDTIVTLFGQEKAEVPRFKTERAEPLGLLAGRRILVVEDSTLNRDVAVALLEEAGLIVETAENGQIAVDMVTGSPKGYYNGVLMDIQMPEMNGYQATQRIREWEHQSQETTNRKPGARNQEPFSKIPIIALTAHALKGEKEKCLAADMDDYLAKPLDEQDLHRVLLKWVAYRQ